MQQGLTEYALRSGRDPGGILAANIRQDSL
jgi:hypothetical protein